MQQQEEQQNECDVGGSAVVYSRNTIGREVKNLWEVSVLNDLLLHVCSFCSLINFPVKR